MNNLVWIGSGITLIGLVGLVWCILRALGARSAGLDELEMRATLQKVVLVNMAALGLSALGLVLGSTWPFGTGSGPGRRRDLFAVISARPAPDAPGNGSVANNPPQ
jgi:hypothetical protein